MINKYTDKSLEVTEEVSVKKEIGQIEQVEQTTNYIQKSITISVKDFVNMAISYTTVEHLPISLGKDNTIGKCLICGVGTNAVERCLCYECHGKNIKPIYEQFMAQGNGNTSAFKYKC